MGLERAGLVQRALRGRIVAFVGPAGAGKTALAEAASRVEPRLVVNVPIERPGSGPEELARAMVAGARAAALRGAGGATELGAIVDALNRAEEPAVLVVDDVHDLTPEGSEVLAGVMETLADHHRVLMTARTLPAALAAAVDLTLEDVDFRLERDDLEALAHASGVALDGGGLAALERASGGWIGAAALVLDRLARQRVGRREALARPPLVAGAISAVLDALEPADRVLVGQLARLPRLLDGVDAGLGTPGLLDRLRDAGLPLGRDRDGRWTMPDWIRDRLADPAGLDAGVATRAAGWYRDAGEPAESVAVLLDAGLVDLAAERLGTLTNAEIDGLDLVDVDALVARFPEATAASAPRVQLLLARLAADAVLINRRTALLERLARDLDELDAPTANEVRAEQARDLIRDGEAEAADRLAAAVLADAGSDELQARAIACEVRGRAAAWFASTESALASARSWLEQALVVANRLGSADLQAAVLGMLGYRVDFPAGRIADAAARLEEAASAIAGRPRRRAMVLTFLAEVEHNRGRFDAAAAALDEAAVVAEELADNRLRAYVAWERARGAGWEGRRLELDACIGEVERCAADWFEHPSGMIFLAEMADLLDRVGDPVRARRFLDRSLERMTDLAIDDPDVLTVAAAVETRHGDAEVALDLLARVDSSEATPPARQWRPLLLGAHARSRLGDGSAGSLAAAAFDRAGSAGVDHLPLLQEPEVATALAGLAAAAGSPVAARLAAASRVTSVTLLGRFEVARSGLPLALPAGQPAQLVKLLATLGGRAHVEVVIDALWPDADPASGRKLVRNVLTRLRRGLGPDVPELVVREGETLAFPPEVDVDAVRFDSEVDRALAVAGIDDTAAAAIGRVAVARYGGELLPDDRYEDWAAGPRERLRHRLVVMLRLLADVASAAGRTDEAMRYLERAIAAEPLDEDHYLQLSRVLIAAGREAAAEQAVLRGARAAAELGV